MGEGGGSFGGVSSSTAPRCRGGLWREAEQLIAQQLLQWRGGRGACKSKAHTHNRGGAIERAREGREGGEGEKLEGVWLQQLQHKCIPPPSPASLCTFSRVSGSEHSGAATEREDEAEESRRGGRHPRPRRGRGRRGGRAAALNAAAVFFRGWRRVRLQ